jgi:hypothetical protein
MAEAIKGRIRGFAEEAGESREFADGGASKRHYTHTSR